MSVKTTISGKYRTTDMGGYIGGAISEIPHNLLQTLDRLGLLTLIDTGYVYSDEVSKLNFMFVKVYRRTR